MRSVITLLGFLSFSSVYAGTVLVHGKFNLNSGNMPHLVVLNHTAEGNPDASSLVKNGTFSMELQIATPVLYNLRLGHSSYDLMLSPRDPDVSIDVVIQDDQVTDMHITPGAETDAYKRFLSIEKLNDNKLEKHFRSCTGAGCEQELQDLLLDFRDDLNDVRSRYKGTYAASVLCKMRMPTIAAEVGNTTAQYRAHYFDSIPFADPAVLSTSVYHDMIVSYITFLIEGTLSSEESFIKNLMTQAKADTKVYNNTALSLFDGLLWHSREKMLAMLIRYYDENKNTLDNPVLAAKITNIRKVMPGNNFTDIVKPDSSGVLRSLRDVVQRSKCTLLLFWSPGCSHCTAEMPYIQSLYGQYRSKGFDIYAYCMDAGPQSWKEYMASHPLPWTNVLAGTGDPGRPAPANDYAVSSTPTLVLIDQKGTILHRFAPKNKLEKYIQEALK